jgi:DUF1680 family protein
MTAVAKSLSRFTLLSPGSISPEGWLGEYALIVADSWLLRRARCQEPGIYDPLWNRLGEDDIHQGETGALEVAYFSDALVRNASMLPRSSLAMEVEPWIERALASQDEDGYLGVYDPPLRWTEDVSDIGEDGYEIFSIGHVIEALIHRYESTGDPRLLSSCERSADTVILAWNRRAGNVDTSNFGFHSPYVLRAMVKLYSLTSDERYASFARQLLDRFGRVEAYLQYGDDRKKSEAASRPRRVRDKVKWEHNVIEAMQVGLPIVQYEFTGDRELLKASLAAWENMQDHLSVDGSPAGNEAIIWNGPRDGCEHCGAVQWMITGHELARITGEVKYADGVERAMYNAYPAAKSVDGMLVAYIHSANQLAASDWSSPHLGNRDGRESKEYFSSSHKPLCCNLNSPRAVPYFVGSMVMAADDGLAILYYGPCRVETEIRSVGKVVLRIETDYPFEDEVRVAVDPEQPMDFALNLRIPGWCESVALTLNGGPLPVQATPGEFAIVRREWHQGDELALSFETPIRLVEFPETHSRVKGVAVQKGPLTFALPVAEDWQPHDATRTRPLKDKTTSYQILPAADAAWNYALVLEEGEIEKSFTLTPNPVPTKSRPWEHPPWGLNVKARRVLKWGMEGDEEHPMTPGLPYKPMQLSDEVTTVTLVPFGFTRLRVAFLPTDGSYGQTSSTNQADSAMAEPAETPPGRG